MSNDVIQQEAEIQPVDKRSTSNDEMDEWVMNIEARIDNQQLSHATRPSMNSNIEKRPSIIFDWQCWDDFGASLIPETQKLHYVACMIQKFGLNLRSYLEYMQDKEDLAWSYYRGADEKFRSENSKRFIEHLLVNSCFLLFVLLLRGEHKNNFQNKILDKNNLPKGLTHRDIENLLQFLLEHRLQTKCLLLTMNYQIPWFVVEVLYTDLSTLSKLFVTPIHQIALSYIQGLYPEEHSSKKAGGTRPHGGFKHLLHIFHWSRTPDGKYLKFSESKKLSHFHIPSAAELQLSQIVFVKDNGGCDLSFSDNRRLSRVMQITPLHFLQYSTKRYESLLRFEHMYSGHCGIPFMAYVACMSSLLKTEADVRVLRENGVIPSTTFDNKDVLRCVQELKASISDGFFTPEVLVLLEKKVMAHYQRSAYRLYGEFKKRYCSNPWITISVFAGILLFILTFIQTVLSFIQTKYSVLSYKQQ